MPQDKIQQREFFPDKSTTAKMLKSKSDKEIFDRYFLPSPKKDWTEDSWLKDINTYIDSTLPGTSKSKFPLTLSLLGEPLNYTSSKIHKKLEAYFPEYYKLNSNIILQDLESLLSENPERTRIASRNNDVTVYIIELSNYLVEVLNRGIDYVNAKQI